MSEGPGVRKLELGKWVGRRQAFGLIATKCSVVDAECLKRIREEKLYRALGVTWDQFCQNETGISRAYADRLIQQLDELGEAYFRLSEMMQMSPETYRQISGAVTDLEIEFDGERIPICRENAARIAEAVAALRRPAPGSAPTFERRLAAAQKRFDSWLAGLVRLSRRDAASREAVVSMLEAHARPALDREIDRAA